MRIIKQRAGHAALATTEGHVVEAKSPSSGFGALPRTPGRAYEGFSLVLWFHV
jgi:hypothetical protein